MTTLRSTVQLKSKDIELLQKLTKKIKEEQSIPQGEGENEVKTDEDQGDDDYPDAYNNAVTGFITHVLFKAIVFIVFVFRGLFDTISNGLVTNEIIVVFAVIDFWFTKNVNGKRLLGLRWYFDVDEHGTEKFFFECRANDKYVSFMWAKLFWIIQIMYSILPFLVMMLGFIQAVYVLINLEMILTSLGILFAGGINMFFFFQANSAAQLKQKEIKRKLSPQALQNVRFATITSYT